MEGSGNRRYGARWNSPGRGVLYASENLSLCVLEAFVHLNPAMRRRLPPRTAVKIEFPDDTDVTDVKRLLGEPRAANCRKFGDRWLDEGRTLILRAPSIVGPQERNLMFNPLHPEMRRVRIVEMTAFVFDERMTQK